MTIQEVIKAIKAHRGPVLVDARIFAHDNAWIEAKKGDLLTNLTRARDEGDDGDYDFTDGYFSPDY